MLELVFKPGKDAAEPDTAPSLEHLEFFCNPNAHTSPFDAKLLVTAKGPHDGLSVTTEARLSSLKADLDEFMAACGSS